MVTKEGRVNACWKDVHPLYSKCKGYEVYKYLQYIVRIVQLKKGNEKGTIIACPRTAAPAAVRQVKAEATVEKL